MTRNVPIGAQRFYELREHNDFYIDKTFFIKDWLKSNDEVTVILRPRRFGKTLTLSMMECFFSTRYANRSDLFEGLSIWNDEEYRKIQGTVPVISITLAAVKSNDYAGFLELLKWDIVSLYNAHNYLEKSDKISEKQKEQMQEYFKLDMSEKTLIKSLHFLSELLYTHYGKKVYIFLDEYDTPLQESYVEGYWKDMMSFMKNFFNASFKSNPYLGRALMTGITRVSKETMFSDFNHIRMVTTLSDMYATAIGFTEKEVFAAMDEYGLHNRDEIKHWYDGFTFGNHHDIYNPWSIIYFLSDKKLGPYWVDTGGERFLSKLLRHGNNRLKRQLETLIEGGSIITHIDENLTYHDLDGGDDVIWSLLHAAGYVCVRSVDDDDYTISITNYETIRLFRKIIKRWFRKSSSYYNEFIQALLSDNLDEMNAYMNQVALVTFSSFDIGKNDSIEKLPERFYHGFVLGLMVDLRKQYIVTSNHESGLGRYDIMLEPRDKEKDAGIIIEFKVHNKKREASLEDTVQIALQQIEDRKYETMLVEKGVSRERIRKYGFAFDGRKVLIG